MALDSSKGQAAPTLWLSFNAAFKEHFRITKFIMEAGMYR